MSDLPWIEVDGDIYLDAISLEMYLRQLSEELAEDADIHGSRAVDHVVALVSRAGRTER